MYYLLAILCCLFFTTTAYSTSVSSCHYECHTETVTTFMPQTYTKYVSEVYYTLEKKQYSRTTPKKVVKKALSDEPKCVDTIEFGLIYQAILDGRDYEFTFGDKEKWNAYVKEGEIVDGMTISYHGKNIKECTSSFPSAGTFLKKLQELIWVPHYTFRTLTIQDYIPIQYDILICELIENNKLISGTTEYNSSTPVPEPSTLILLGTGLISIVFLKRKK